MAYYKIILAVILLYLNTLAIAERGILIEKLDSLQQNKRIALVIGNGDYQSSPLKNPVNDATAMGKILKQNGFKVIQKLNANRRQMEEAINQFGKKLRAGGTGFFYYAGHGIQIDGNNYLIPTNASIDSESDVKYEAVDAGRILGEMYDAGNSLNIVVMDACRNNPFSRNFRSAAKGLAKMNAPTGTIIAYATAPGSVAADGNDKNGLYTKYLLKYLNQPNLKIEDVFKNVRIAVVKDSGKKQVPWESSSLIGNFVFNINELTIINGDNTNIKKTDSISANQAEDEYWNLIHHSSAPIDYKNYLKEYPEGKYKKVARLKLKKLKDNNVFIIKGEWNAWHESQAISKLYKLSKGAIKWQYSIPEIVQKNDAGLFLSIVKQSITGKRIHLKFTSKAAFPIDLAIYSFVAGYSKNNDFDSLVRGDFRLNLKTGKNEFFIDSKEFHIPDWWLEENGKPSIMLSTNDIRGLEFNIELDSGFGSPTDTLIFYTIEIID